MGNLIILHISTGRLCLPNTVHYRSKQGFALPLVSWILPQLELRSCLDFGSAQSVSGAKA